MLISMSSRIFQWCEVLSVYFSLTYTCSAMLPPLLLSWTCPWSLVTPEQLYFLRNDSKVNGSHWIVHQRSDTVSLLHIHLRSVFTYMAFTTLLVCSGFISLITHLPLNSNLMFDWWASAVLNPCFPFLSYFNYHLINFTIPMLISSNLYFILMINFLQV